MSSAASPVAASWSASAAARTSIHSNAGRMTWLFLSTATTVAEVESTPMPTIASAGTPDFWTAPRTEVMMHSHHSLGLCSARPDRGKVVFHSVATEASSLPSVSKTPARAPPVPMSMPSRYGPLVMAISCVGRPWGAGASLPVTPASPRHRAGSTPCTTSAHKSRTGGRTTSYFPVRVPQQPGLWCNSCPCR